MDDVRKNRVVSLREPIGVALETLRAHKLRSFLMLLGIILSVSTLIIVIALISGVNRYIAERVANLGSNVFVVARFPIITEVDEYVKATRRNKLITLDDYQALRDNLKLPLRQGVEVDASGKVRANGQGIDDTEIRGVSADMADIDVEEPASGRYISEADDLHRAMVT
ncbi:MAG: ABC transporter permease, partial [Candidatus Acidiferrales bacterium]